MNSRRSFLVNISMKVSGLAIGSDPVATRAVAESSSPLDEWTKQLGNPRVVFDVADIRSPDSLTVIRRVLDGYRSVISLSPPKLGVVVVVRRQAVAMLVDSQVWRQYDIPEGVLGLDVSSGWKMRNPFFDALATVQRRGAVILGCQLALNELLIQIAKKRQTDREELIKVITSTLLPGAIMLPNGLFGLARAQNVGCALVRN